MLPGKMRFTSLIALAVLLLTSAGQSSIGVVPASGQESAQLKRSDARLQDLLAERLAAARALAKLAKARFANNQSDGVEVIGATRIAHEAALDLCKTDQERVKVLSSFLEAAKENERIALGFQTTGQGREATALLAKVERLRVEIALERATAQAAGTVTGGTQAPPIKKADAPRTLLLTAQVEAYESVRIACLIPGFLKEARVDIGDRVKKDQALAELYVPELQSQVRLDEAAVNQARARVEGARTRAEGAEANCKRPPSRWTTPSWRSKARLPP